MGRKRKKILKPWCWYCEREFDEEKVLIHHQKSKHFKCSICQKKLYTGPGLVIHCSQVHKESVTEIPNALPHRNNLEIDIYGTEGIPEKDRVDRERNRGSGVGDDSAKKFKTETGIAFVPAPPGMIPMMPVMHGPPGAMPLHVMPSQFMPPAVLPVPPTAPPGIGVMPPAPMAPPPERPLFPSGMHHDVHAYSATDHKPGPPPLFPSGVLSALDQSKESSKQPSNRTSVGYSVSISDTVKLMHPDNEISMEELRASLPKYATHHPPILPPQPLHMHPPPPDPMAKGEFQSGPMFYPTHPTIRPHDFPPPHFDTNRMQKPYKHY